MGNFRNQSLATACFVILFCITANAQTNVSGFISANTTWNLAGSPYLVIGNVLVSHGYTLTIDPGVVVKFNTNKAIQIDGELIAIGTPQNRITFTSNQANPAPGDWANIHFPDTCANAVFDVSGNYLSGSIMKYCDVIYGGSIGNGEIHIESSSPYFSHCKIMNSMHDGIYCHGSSYVLDSSVVKNCAGHGLTFDQIHLTSCSLVISGDSVENNQGGGVYAHNSSLSCSTIIHQNYFYGNAGDGAVYFYYTGVNSANITENHFINNNGVRTIEIGGNNILVAKNLFENNSAGPSQGILNITGGNDSVQCNRFLYNQTGVYGKGAVNMNCSNSAIESNIFDGNFNNTVYGVAVTNAEGLTLSNTISFSRNTVRNNSAPLSSCCKFVLDIFWGLLLNLDHNNFENNTAENVVYMYANHVNTPYSFLYMKHNNFSNPGAQHDFYNNTLYGDPDLYVDSNYWGGTSTQHIDSVIYDYFDDATKSVVYYSPVLSFEVVIDTSCAPGLFSGINNIETTGFNSTIFPNPATAHLTIAFDKIINKGTIEIYDVLGEMVLKENINRASKIEVSLQNILPGIYIVNVLDGEKQFIKKLIVEHN